MEIDDSLSDGRNPVKNGPEIRHGWPSCLNTKGYPYFVKVLRDMLTVTYVGKGNHAHDVGSVRADHPLPKDIDIYYYEAHVIDAGAKGKIAVGLASSSFLLTRQTGSTPDSYGYRGDQGRKFNGMGSNGGTGTNYAPQFGTGDYVGCGVNAYTGEMFFTKNGTFLGVAFQVGTADLYPTISMHSYGETVQANFGNEPFKFDIDLMRTEERAKMDAKVNACPLDHAVIRPLIRSYCLHHGLMQTLQALDSSYGKDTIPDSEYKAMGVVGSGDSAPTTHQQQQQFQFRSSDEMLEATLQSRSHVRELIIDGDIKSALQQIDLLCPGLINSPSHDLAFQLHCLQFIQFMRNQQTKEAVQFARETLSGYAAHPDKQTTIQNVMGLLAFEYPDMGSCPVSYLLQRSYRQDVALQTNAAIIAYKTAQASSSSSSSSSPPSRSSLETLLAQLVAVHDTIRSQRYGIFPPLTLFQDHNTPFHPVIVSSSSPSSSSTSSTSDTTTHNPNEFLGGAPSSSTSSSSSSGRSSVKRLSQPSSSSSSSSPFSTSSSSSSAMTLNDDDFYDSPPPPPPPHSQSHSVPVSTSAALSTTSTSSSSASASLSLSGFGITTTTSTGIPLLIPSSWLSSSSSSSSSASLSSSPSVSLSSSSSSTARSLASAPPLISRRPLLTQTAQQQQTTLTTQTTTRSTSTSSSTSPSPPPPPSSSPTSPVPISASSSSSSSSSSSLSASSSSLASSLPIRQMIRLAVRNLAAVHPGGVQPGTENIFSSGSGSSSSSSSSSSSGSSGSSAGSSGSTGSGSGRQARR